MIRNYTPSGPTLRAFHNDDTRIRAIMGPFGSAKSSACAIEIMRRAVEQHRGLNGKRCSKWMVIRNTYRELQDSTIRTCLYWWPEGNYRTSEMIWKWKDGDVELEVLFRSLDREGDIGKLLSTDLTGIYVNEAREIGWPVISMAAARVGRFPSRAEGGSRWTGVLMDSNPPDTDSWWYKIFETQCPAGWKLFQQPSGRSPHAENLDNLEEGYYQHLMAGQDDDWISVYVDGEYGTTASGKPVHPLFKKSVHVSMEPLQINPYAPAVIGCDFGLTPAAVIGQEDPATARLVILREIVCHDMDADELGKEICQMLGRDLYGVAHEGWGDPAGVKRAEADKKTVYDALADHKLKIGPTHTNDPVVRKRALDVLLRTLRWDGKPAILIDGTHCPILVRALLGKFCYKRVAIGNEERYRDVPDKNEWSHVAEGLQYLCVGLGHGYSAEAQMHDSMNEPVLTVHKAGGKMGGGAATRLVRTDGRRWRRSVAGMGRGRRI